MLLSHQQPITFDPSNREHRLAVESFMKNKTWGNIRFAGETGAYGSIPHQVQTRLLEWYLQQEKISAKGTAECNLAFS